MAGHRGWGAEFVQNYLAMPFAVPNLKLECISIPYVRSEEIHHTARCYTKEIKIQIPQNHRQT